MKPLDQLILSPESWRPIEPVTGRSSNRTSERELERIPTHVILGQGRLAVKLWDYSPFGLAFLSAHGPDESQQFRKGDSLKIRFHLGNQNLETECRVENTCIHKGGLRVGLSRKDLLDYPPFHSDEGSLRISDGLKIAGEMTNPLLYGEWCAMNLASVHPGLRLAFTSNDPTLILFSDQEISVDLALPSSAENTYTGRVVAIGRLEDEIQTFLLEPTRMSPGFAAELADVLAGETGASPEILKGLGFPIRFLRDRLDFRYAETMEDYAKVLALRREACLVAGKSISNRPPEAMSFQSDRNSRILCVFQEDKLVATATLNFPGSKKDKLKAESTLGDTGLPDRVPPKTDIVEVHSVGLHPDYRKGDLLLAMVEHIGRAFVLSDRKFLLKVCAERLLPQHRRIGFRTSGAPLIHNGEKAHILLLEKKAVLFGKGLSVSNWLALFGDLASDLLEKGLIEPEPWTGFTTRTKLRLKPLLQEKARFRSGFLFRDFLFDNRKQSQ